LVSLIPRKRDELRPGDKLDRYELLCLIAEGGMGACWVARQQGKRGFEKLVALKTMKEEYAADPDFQKMFLDEARIASKIEHPNVAHIVDLGEQDGILFLVMEYVDGDSLRKIDRDIVRKKSIEMPPNVLLRIVADICAGLHVAHELTDGEGKPLGVVHRDVSPHNILVSTKGVSKLIDFGIAKARDRLSGATTQGEFKGKVHFMAPEQARGTGVDRRADIFSLGAVLYNLLAGRPPFAGENEVASMTFLMSGRPPPPLPNSVPGPIAAVVLRALSHERERRYATALEMKNAIEEAMLTAHLVATPETVAAFVAEHLGDRAEARQKAITAALGRSARNTTPLRDIGKPASGSEGAESAAMGAPQGTRVGLGDPAKRPISGDSSARGRRRPLLSMDVAPTLAATVGAANPRASGRRNAALLVAAGAAAVIGAILAVTFRGGGERRVVAQPPAASVNAPATTQEPEATPPDPSVSSTPPAPPPTTSGKPRPAAAPPTRTATPASPPAPKPRKYNDGF
jgi:eukaryotic-like serine/threonine-protein kinase